MKLRDVVQKSNFEMVVNGGNQETTVSKVFCCDLLSIAMSKNPSCSVWVTVMGNVNCVAVCVLTEGACIILAEGTNPDEQMIEKAKQHGITILKTDLPVFDAALVANNIINE